MPSPLCVGQRVAQLAHRGDWHLASWELSTLLTTVAGPMCSPGNSEWESCFLPTPFTLSVIVGGFLDLGLSDCDEMENDEQFWGGKKQLLYGTIRTGNGDLKKRFNNSFFYFFCISVCLNVSIYTWVQVSTTASEGVRYHGAGITVGLALHRCGAQNQTWVLCKNSMCS